MNSEFLNVAIKESNKCYKYDDVPVGAVIVKNNKIISKSHNTREKNNQIISHAEINAILKANRKLKNYFLYDCDLYVTLEPCSMCKKVINSARIRNVYYILKKEDSKKEYEKTTYQHVDSEQSKLYSKKMKSFFDKLR